MKIVVVVILNLLMLSCNTKNISNKVNNKSYVINSIAVETISKDSLNVRNKNIPFENTNAESLNDNVHKQIGQNIYSIMVENNLILLLVKNNYDKPIYYTSEIKFQKWNGTKWQKFDFIKNYIFNSMEYILRPGEIRKHPFYFSSFATKPEKGKYKAIKSYYFQNKVKKEEIIQFNIY